MLGRRGRAVRDDLNTGIEELEAAIQESSPGFLLDEEPDRDEEDHDRIVDRVAEKDIPRATVARRAQAPRQAE